MPGIADRKETKSHTSLRSDKGYKHLTIRISEELHTRVKHLSVDFKMHIYEFFEKGLTKYCEEMEDKKEGK